MKKNKKLYAILALIIILVIIDQITKNIAINNNGPLINGVLNITTVENKGGAFGVGQNGTGTFIITNIVVIGIIIRFMIMQKEQIDKKTYFALSMIIAGGLGNFIDRIFRGFVVDFLDLTPIIKMPVFNISDIYILVGWILLALFFAMFACKDVKVKKAEDDNIE